MRLVFLPMMAGLCAARIWAAETAVDLAAKVTPVPLCATLVAAARTNQIPLDRIEPARDTNVLGPGDSFSALVTLCETGARRTQWLLYSQAEPPESTKPAAKPPTPLIFYFCEAFNAWSRSARMSSASSSPTESRM